MPRAKGRSVVFKGSKVSEAPQGADWMQTEAIKQAERPSLGGWIDIKNDIIFSSQEKLNENMLLKIADLIIKRVCVCVCVCARARARARTLLQEYL